MPFNKTSIFVSTETHTEINCVCPDVVMNLNSTCQITWWQTQ